MLTESRIYDSPSGRVAMKPVLSVLEARDYTGLSKSTLDKMRCTGEGPKFVRLGKRKIGYFSVDLDEWMRARTHTSTSEYQAAARRR